MTSAFDCLVLSDPAKERSGMLPAHPCMGSPGTSLASLYNTHSMLPVAQAHPLPDKVGTIYMTIFCNLSL